VLYNPVHDLDSIPGFPACPSQLDLTSVLTPALSSRRGRIIRRHSKKPATGLAGPSFAKPEPGCGCSFSPGEKVRLRADVKTVPFPHSSHETESRPNHAMTFKWLMRKTAPFGSLGRHSISQPCARTICWTTANPSPVPF